MAIRLETGEVIHVLDAVTTLKEITQQFPISRGALVMHMYKDRFEWVQICGTFIIDRESFVDFWNEKHQNSLDVDCTSK